MTKRIERCCICDEPTGRGGKDEDSVYCDECGMGPFCDECWIAHDCARDIAEAIEKPR